MDTMMIDSTDYNEIIKTNEAQIADLEFHKKTMEQIVANKKEYLESKKEVLSKDIEVIEVGRDIKDEEHLINRREYYYDKKELDETIAELETRKNNLETYKKRVAEQQKLRKELLAEAKANMQNFLQKINMYRNNPNKEIDKKRLARFAEIGRTAFKNDDEKINFYIALKNEVAIVEGIIQPEKPEPMPEHTK